LRSTGPSSKRGHGCCGLAIRPLAAPGIVAPERLVETLRSRSAAEFLLALADLAAGLEAVAKQYSLYSNVNKGVSGGSFTV